MIRPWRIGVLAAACAAAAAYAVAADDDPGADHTDRELWRVRAQVEHSGERRIGRDFACAVVHRRRLRIFVTSRNALPRADAVRWRLPVADQTDLDVVSPRFRRTTMLEIRESVEMSLPSGGPGSAARIAIAHSDGPRCSPVEIGMHGGGVEWRKWRRGVLARYGADRVHFREIEPMTKDVPPIDVEIPEVR